MTRNSNLILPPAVSGALTQYRRRWRLFHLSSGLLGSLAMVIGGVVLAIVADRLLQLSDPVRLACLIVLAAGLLALLAARAVWPIVRRFSDRHAAIGLGQSFPKVREDLVTAVELTGRDADPGVSPSLIARALNQISTRAKTINPRSAVPIRPVLLAFGAFVALVGLLLTSHTVQPEAFDNALNRLLHPTQHVPYYCYTKLTVTSADRPVAIGDSATVTAEVAGEVPARASLEIRTKAAVSTNSLPIEAGKLRWVSGPLFEDLEYRLTAGDAASDWRRVRVVPPPALASKSVFIRYPAYTDGQTETISPVPMSLPIVEGSSVEVQLLPVSRGSDPGFACRAELIRVKPATRPDSPAAVAPAAGSQPDRIALLPGSDGLLRSPMLQLAADAKYAIRLADGFGLVSRASEELDFRIAPDEKPHVAINSPARDLLLLHGEAVVVEASARDNFGLRDLGLQTRRGKLGDQNSPPTFEAGWNSNSKPLSLAAGGPRLKDLAGKVELNVDALGLVPGEVLEYKASAADFAGPAAERTSESSTYRIVVLSDEQHLAMTLTAMRDVKLALLKLAAREKAESANAARLAGKAKADSVTDEAHLAQERQNDIGRDTEKLAKEIESVAAEISRNPSASPEMMASLEQLSRAVRNVADEPISKASDKMGEAADSKQEGEKKKAEQSSAMAGAKEHTDEAVRRLEGLAKAAEQAAGAGQMSSLAAQAAKLAAWQRNLKEATKSVAAKTVGKSLSDLTPEERKAIEDLAKAEKVIQEGIDKLAKDAAEAANKLANTDPAAAAQAGEAAGKIESAKMADRAGDISKSLGQNVLLTKLPDQDALAKELADLAKSMTRPANEDAGEAIVKQIEQFIKRQTDINKTAAGLPDKGAADKLSTLGDKQTDLARDVSEQASAIELLAQELDGFDSKTAAKLNEAAREMTPGASDFYDARRAEGLVHGEKALALLLESRESAEQEKSQNSQAGKNAGSMAALLLLQRIIGGQQKVNQGTVDADKDRAREDAFRARVADLARDQAAVRVDADKLAEMLAENPDLADYITRASDKMDLSRLALDLGRTDKDVRIVQRQILVMLEALLKAGKSGGGGSKLQMARIAAMMQMMALMQQPGAKPGGYAGGSNANLMPAALGPVGSEAWRKSHSKFDEPIGAGYDADFPAEYKDQLNAYFDRLRKEPPK